MVLCGGAKRASFGVELGGLILWVEERGSYGVGFGFCVVFLLRGGLIWRVCV